MVSYAKHINFYTLKFVSFSCPLSSIHILECGSLSLLGVFDGKQRRSLKSVVLGGIRHGQGKQVEKQPYVVTY